MVTKISERNLSTDYYRVKEKNELPEEVILDEETAFDILKGSEDPEDIQVLGSTPASFRIGDVGIDYKGAGYLRFGETEAYSEAELHTQSDELRRGPGLHTLYISVLPKVMDPNRVGRNPLV